MLIGAEEKHFTVHKDILFQHSTFFTAALNGEFREAKERPIRLPETDPEAFAIFAQWAYRNELIVMEEEDFESDSPGRHQERQLYIRTYILADQLGVVRLQNQIMDDYIKLMLSLGVGPGSKDVNLIYRSLPEQSLMRKLMVDFYVSRVKAEWLKAHVGDFAEEFVKESLIAFAEALQNQQRPIYPDLKAQCFYHVHNDEVPACNTTQHRKVTAK